LNESPRVASRSFGGEDQTKDIYRGQKGLPIIKRLAQPEFYLPSLRLWRRGLEKSLSPRRTNLLLLASFAVLAFTLALIGIYGVIAYGRASESRKSAC
jgi:hypothetical protein